MEVPKAMIVEKIRGKSGAEKANEADKELPDKVDTETDAALLEKYGLSHEDLSEDFGGQAPSAG
ncbi:hypothetical protein GBA63_04390 [Rubrobacter tropicus]|uniref:Uncharacterized protein n=1 Tax=Rubrobacter tropicus TaxID=2653851 RepID=A0A6G8Q682_9ACTN|nr:hypothetical protein [Rubrobacter tropicus]QIN81966.1 hypothetical protein GBA63_04390 [Rubrobacter tropicus]